jgi:ABC-type lipoprotein export system ATPase subunit
MLKRSAVQENRAILIVSHDARILEFADEVHSLEDGVLRPGGGRGAGAALPAAGSGLRSAGGAAAPAPS